MKRTHSPEEVAEALGVGRRWLLEAAQAGRIPSVKIARRVRFTDDHVAQIIEAHTRHQRKEMQQDDPWARTRRRAS